MGELWRDLVAKPCVRPSAGNPFAVSGAIVV
jgi:hypothetical protein